MSAIDYILTILILASLYLNWHLVQVCRSARKKPCGTLSAC